MADIVVFRPEDDWPGLKKLESDPVVDLEPEERRSAYRFHRDAFSLRLAYVRHPHYSQFLIPLSEYTEYVLQDKFNEALRVLTALGASTIRCSSHRTQSKSFGGAMRVPKVVKVDAKRGHTSNSHFDYEYAGAGAAPVDPRPLKWPSEPGMQAAIDGVLRNGATSVRITVKRDDAITMDAEIPLRLRKIGVEFGLHSTRSQVDTLDFDATFPPRPIRQQGWLR